MRFRLAFSMIELVMVIVVIGILASVAIPNMDKDIRQGAIDTVLSDVRLAQQNALSDDKHDVNNTKWQRAYWHFAYYTCGNDVVYRVASDVDFDGTITNSESALNSKDNKYLFADCNDLDDKDNSPKVNLTREHGISSVTTTGACQDSHILAFDNLGRLHSDITSELPDYAHLVTKDSDKCQMRFSFQDDNLKPFTLEVTPIVGHIKIVEQEYL